MRILLIGTDDESHDKKVHSLKATLNRVNPRINF